jgi:DNA polymerase III gamma/tau subunit
MKEEWYKKYRPKTFSEVLGQTETVRCLSKAIKDEDLPHAILLSGIRGTGKTSIARILRNELKCKDDYVEINMASSRGIDTIREIEDNAPLDAQHGNYRMWVLDEFHRATSDASSSLLKILEDPPSHAYFVLATTDPQKLLPTIRSRCTHYELSPLSDEDMTALLHKIRKAEGCEVHDKVIRRIVEISDGSARGAINLLQKVSKLEDGQLELIEKAGAKKSSRSLAQILMDERSSWSDVCKVIEEIEDEPERVRQGVLGYASAVMLKDGRGKNRANLILNSFSDPMYDSGRWQIVRAAWEVLGEH